MRKHGQWEGELRHRTKEGREVFVSARLQLMHGGDGIDRVLETNRDITERKRTEDALHQSEERLRQMIETSPVAIGFGDSTGKIFEANESFYRLTGYTAEEIQASKLGWNQLTAPEYAELDSQIMTTLAGTGSAGPYEKEYIRKDGSRIPCCLASRNFRGAMSTSPSSWTSRSVRRSKNKCGRRRRLSRGYSTAARLAMALARLDDGCVVDVNARWEEMTGRRRADVIGKTAPSMAPGRILVIAWRWSGTCVRAAAPSKESVLSFVRTDRNGRSSFPVKS